MEENDRFRCKKCNGLNVTIAWSDSGTADDPWCHDCADYVPVSLEHLENGEWTIVF